MQIKSDAGAFSRSFARRFKLVASLKDNGRLSTPVLRRGKRYMLVLEGHETGF